MALVVSPNMLSDTMLEKTIKNWVMRKNLESLGFKPLLTQHIVTLMPCATYPLSAFLRIVLKCIMKTGCNAAV
jgi:hypothetical protein